MSREFLTDVVICGAGAAGLTLAIDLARRGVPFRLFDRLEAPFRGSRGKGIQPRTLEVFEDLGIVDRIAAAGGPYPPQRVYREDGGSSLSSLFEAAGPTAAEPYRMPLLVPQYLTERVMRERLVEGGHAPQSGRELIDFEQDADGVTARLAGRDGVEIVRARYLVGADGGRSTVRHALAIDFPGKTLGVRAIVADVDLEGLDRDAWHRFGEGSMEGQLSLCPLAGTDMFQLQAPIPLEGAVDLSPEGLTSMAAARTGRDDIRIRSVSWASAFTMNARLADRYRSGRVFLVGDAAHVHPPTGGQGLNTSVQDAYNLGWKLAAVLGGAPESLLETYEEERRPIAAAMLGLTTTLLDDMKRGGMRRGRDTQQLDIGYPGSSLALETPERISGVIAGDRAPDAPVCGAAGQQTRLFTLFKGPHWTLLGYGTVRRAAMAPRRGLHMHRIGPGGEFVDGDGHVGAAYSVSDGDWILVRPDGYVAAIRPGSDTDAIETYLQQVGLPKPA